MSQLTRYQKAKIIGPGVWYVGHHLCEKAAKTKDPKIFDLAYGFIEEMRYEFICKVCRSHINDFALKDNPARFVETKDAEGLATWWYNLHNNANQHAGNSVTESREDVKKFFQSEEGACDLDCDKDEENVLKKPAPSLYAQVRGDLRSSFVVPTHITEYVSIRR
jgi:hypothetical protein